MMLAIELSDCIQRSISKAMSSSTNILTFLHRLLDSNIIGLVKYFCYSLKSLFLSRLLEPTRTVLEISSETPLESLLKTPSKTRSRTLFETRLEIHFNTP